jgi:hypothetical protein
MDHTAKPNEGGDSTNHLISFLVEIMLRIGYYLFLPVQKYLEIYLSLNTNN